MIHWQRGKEGVRRKGEKGGECKTVAGREQSEMKRGKRREAAVSDASLQHPSVGVFINTSGECLADNLLLSIPFNPLKDLNVH